MRAFLERPRLTSLIVTAFTAVMLSQVLPALEDQPAAPVVGQQSVPGSVFEGQITSVGKDRFTMLTGNNPTGAAAPQGWRRRVPWRLRTGRDSPCSTRQREIRPLAGASCLVSWV